MAKLTVKACVSDAWDAPVRISEKSGTEVEALAQETVVSLRFETIDFHIEKLIRRQ